MFYVYGLRIVGDDEYRYIGCTSEPEQRHLAHRSYDKGNRPKYDWMRSNAGAVEMVILAQIEDEYDASVKEANLIARYRRDGHRLFNKHGRGVVHLQTDETRAKLSRPKKRRATKAQRDAAARRLID